MADIWDSYILLHSVVTQNLTASECVCAVIDQLSIACPHNDWDLLRTLPFDDEVSVLADDWFIPVIREEPPQAHSLTGLFFGLFHPIRDGIPVTDLYFSGSPDYTLDDEYALWASHPAYFPDGRYAQSQVLASVHQLAYGARHLPDAQEFVSLAYLAAVAKHLLSYIDPSLLVAAANPIGVAIGWDAGDPLYVGTISEVGFIPRPIQDASASIAERKRLSDLKYGQ